MQQELAISDFPKTETPIGRNEPAAASSTDEPGRIKAGPDHWEQEKEKLTLALTERLLRGREGVAFSELKKFLANFFDHRPPNVGEIVLAFLRRQARQIIRQEKPLVLQSHRRFELEDNEFRAQLRQLRDLLMERLVFDKNELQAAIAFAVGLNFDLITRPAATLLSLLYRHAEAREKADIAVILEGFEDDYPFVATAQRFLMEYPEGPVTQEAFAALCRRTEREVYRLRPATAVIAALRTYQKFCAAIGLGASSRISAQTVLRMLRERGLSDLAENAAAELLEQESWSLPEIAPILERCEADLNLRAQLIEPVIPPLEDELEGGAIEKNEANTRAVEAQPAVVQPAPEMETVASQAEIFPPPAAEEFQEVDLKAILQVEKAASAPVSKVIYNHAEDEEPPSVEHAKIEAQPPGPYPSITRLIDEKSRQAFIKKVFQKDLDAYLDFIERLEELQTWKQAKAFLDAEFKKRRVNPYSKEAVQLSDVVFGRYFVKGGK
ncbi:MAG: hypothetical protein ONB46_01310 [candidate division KSB1 bacterium]|nr:hypothetical protein [candidate division KSB1 bacterium]MDZ7364521.1 hypothetical protein [candidate division KSB1 bacterium]MDZ7405776.1 hypothetical protein [candidate division KSB1 bacterium]